MKIEEIIQKTVSPPTQKHSYMAIRSYPSETERNLAVQKNSYQWPHIRPNSVLIAPMSYHWSPGSWERVVKMMQYTLSRGSYVGLQEIQDRCFNPYDALGTMRNEAILCAESEGFEYLCYLDNDVLPDETTLSRLLAWDMPAVAPLVFEPGTGKQLSGPALARGSGLHPGKWAVLSMLLFRTAVFRPFQGMFWGDAIGADEGWHFQRLWAYTGHRIYIDTNTELKVGKEPLYPLAMNRFSFEERANIQKRTIERLNLPPDRRASDPYGKGVVDGDYIPFLGANAQSPVSSNETALMPLAISQGKEITKYGWGS